MTMSAELHMRNGGPTLVDADDLPRLAGWGWHVMSAGYVGAMTSRRSGKRTIVLLHRLLMDPPPGLQVDHINGEKLDNRKSNLRIVTPTRNLLNRWRLGTNNKSGILGVCSRDGRWRATIRVNGHQIALGQFERLEDAAEARWAGELRYFGELFPLSRQARARWTK